MNFEIVTHPQRLQEVWPRVASGLSIILDYCPDTWLPEDVYVAIKGQRAFLTIVDYNEGFFVTEVRSDPHILAKNLHVWALYMKSDPYRTPEVRRQIVQEIDRQAQMAGCDPKKTTFASPRKGWGKFIAEFFKEKIVVYERGQT